MIAEKKSGLSEQIEQNLESLVSLQRREWEQRTPSQTRVERVSRVIGRPMYLLILAGFTVLWILYNILSPALRGPQFDPYPFPLLDGILSLAALVCTTVLLIAQNLQTKLEAQYTHLALQMSFLTEQKVTKVIHLLEELRHDLPMVEDRHDPEAQVLQETAEAEKVLSAIKEAGLVAEPTASDPKKST
jgi:uncharacterized membrane protein